MELAQDFMGIGRTESQSEFKTEKWKKIKFGFSLVGKPVPSVGNGMILVETVYPDFSSLREAKKGEVLNAELFPFCI